MAEDLEMDFGRVVSGMSAHGLSTSDTMIATRLDHRSSSARASSGRAGG